MVKGLIERDHLRLINSERTVLELFLIVYPFLFVTAGSPFASHYIWLILSACIGVIAFFLFSRVEYSKGYGMLLATLLAVPFYFLELPLVIVVLLFVYSFWRFHANFNDVKVNGWSFLVLNTVLFVTFCLLSIPFFSNANPQEFMNTHTFLYITTTVLYFFIRFAVIGMIGYRLGNFSIGEAGKMFGGILGLQIVTFFAVYFLLEPLRTGAIAVMGFLFGGLFNLIGKATEPMLDAMIAYLDAKRAEHLEGTEGDVIFIDFKMQEETETYGAVSGSMDLAITIAVAIVAIIVFVLIIRKWKQTTLNIKKTDYSFKLTGRKKSEKKFRPIYDYSEAHDAVRNAFKHFEEEAQSWNAPRLQGETVKEWFSRMDWGCKEGLFHTYDKVRYGSHLVTEEEGRYFIDKLEKIKSDFFIVDV
ncbi:hypothetical protein [Sporosarcina limicola]|uniref:DUF4129 domain-containing protein n=1 Tax=Sporosarcina limicola TaxID=34101 RepID=A0A927MF87_9BACL|nr:hypothetical protein [Sporosarcina limicola]MBE1553639.1 hypothetical protein [Sporosarcina limicola]